MEFREGMSTLRYVRFSSIQLFYLDFSRLQWQWRLGVVSLGERYLVSVLVESNLKLFA